MDKMKLRRTNKKETSDSEQSSDSSEPPSLKKGNSSISELADSSTKSNKRPGSPLEEDSLADFKLPKLNSRSNLARNGVKLLDNPKKSTRTKSNSSRNTKKKPDSNQMSIESSFFKPPTAFVCPLCLKSFNESSQQIAHSKNCAVKNRISTRQLIAATELHERQAEERKAIGLPAAPIQQQQLAKKTPKFKRMSTSNDPDVELAIALSKSLSEAQEIEDLEEAVVLAAESDEKILEMSSSQRKSTLVNFGFITNKPIVLDSNEKPKKKKIGPTILQTRTEEARSRLLAERIAEAIVDNVISTQEPITPDSMNNKYKQINFKSMVLKEIYRSDCKLWNGSAGEESIEFYYIKNLCQFIRPVENFNKRKSKDKLYINKSDDKVNEIRNINQNDCMSPINENVNKVTDISSNRDSIFNLSNGKEDLIKNEDTKENVLKNNDREKKDEDENEKRFEEDRLKGLNPLALSWSKMINSKLHSDVIIYVKNEKFIFSHFLVLWTRCREIEKDFIANNADNNESKYNAESLERKQQWKIMWEDIEYQAGIIFLEFIYCESIINLEALKDRLILNNVKNLAEKYKMKELNYFLEKLDVPVDNLNTECQLIENDDKKIEEPLYIEPNESKDEEYSNSKWHEDQNFSMEKNENEESRTNKNVTTDFQCKSLEFSAQVIDDNDINIQEKDDNSVNKINVNGPNTKNLEATVITISEDELELSQTPKIETKTYKHELLRASFMSASPDIFDGMETMNLGNSFGRKYQNTRNSDNYTVEHCLENDQEIPTCTALCNENEDEIKENEEDITKKKSFQIDEEICLDGFTQTVEEHSGKEELSMEKNCLTNEEVSETTNQVTEKNYQCEKVSKDISTTRNNLSLFIEKIQRKNARFLESDTDEDDSMVMNPRKKKNKFKICRLSENDSGLLNKFRQKDLMHPEEDNLECDVKVEKKSALSIFEDDIRKRVAKEIKEKAEKEINLLKNTQDGDLQENFSECNSDVEFVDEHWIDIKNSVTDLNDDLQERIEENKSKVDQKYTQKFDNILANESIVQSEDANSDGANESMYTKYKKTHRRNSIDKYRAALKNYFNDKSKKTRSISTEEENNSESNEDSSENVENTDESPQSSPKKSFKVAESPIKDNTYYKEKTNELYKNKRISLINQKNLTELSSFDFYEIEDVPEEGRTEDDENSTQNSQEVINRSIDLTVTSDEEKSIETYDKMNEDVSNSKKSNNKINSIEVGEMYEEDFDSMDWNEAGEVNCSSNQNDSNHRSRKQPDDKDISLIVKSNWEPHPPRVDWKNEKSSNDSFTQLTGTPTVTENITKLLQECGVLSSSYQNKDKPRISIADILSPIVLSSDGENDIDNFPDNLFLNFDGEIKNNVSGNCSQNDEEMNFTQFEYEGGANTDFAELSDLRLSTHLPIISSTQYLEKPSVNSRLSQASNRSKHDISSDEDEKLVEEAKNSKSRRCSSISPLKNKSQRLLQVKSQSEGNFSNSRRSLQAVRSDEKTKYSRRKRNNQKNEEICQFLGLSPSKVDISFDVSPKESYDQLSSPELQKRLTSFGLKNQERHRAVKLLNFIWDQMHPLVPENLIPHDARNNHSDVDNDKNKNLGKNRYSNLRKTNEKDSSEDDSKDEEVNRLHRTGFPEEFEFSDDDDGNNDENHLIKKLQQSFEKLLEKDCILHRKILMYEPISLDIFSEKLKESGFIVKPKILADFLNSECISFFIDAPKKWSGNIRKNRKK
ncbi:MATH and LRR domain-containing protein PFE0570w [Chelonus insularis]|uniref:MATH and LRR domain-containing protein PFE0570w n=1 Tax=Chelonus insularis TaxID=460826 RepID=UPI00158F0124|nr:MATH and LRR domain-containing protein PFE0570w [Chelonus insularis]